MEIKLKNWKSFWLLCAGTGTPGHLCWKLSSGGFGIFWDSTNLKGSLRHHSNTLILANSQFQRVTQTINQTTSLRPSVTFSQSHNLKESSRHHSYTLRLSVVFSQSHNLWEGASFKTGMTWRQSGSMCILGRQAFIEYLFDFHVYSRF